MTFLRFNVCSFTRFALVCFLIAPALFQVFSMEKALSYPWLEQISRQEEVCQACANLRTRTNTTSTTTPLNVTKLEHILVDHTHRLLYCYVPKVACTNWKRVFMVLTGTSNVTNPLDIPASVAHDERSTLRLSQLSSDLARECLDDYTAFLVVRHPFERLLSAYRNKFLGDTPSSKYFQNRYGRYIIKKYRPKPSEQSLRSGEDVTFREFARYLISEGSRSNEHWAPIYDLCYPCLVHYAIVARYEKMAEDARMVLSYVGAPPLVFPLTRAGGTQQRLRYYFQQLNIKEIESLYRIYENDFKLFGYDLEAILGFDIG